MLFEIVKCVLAADLVMFNIIGSVMEMCCMDLMMFDIVRSIA